MAAYSQSLIDDPHLRRALALWAVLALAVCVKTALLGGEHSVYPVFAAASRHWWADKSLYADYQQSEGIDGYRYSPAFALAFTPLAYLPDRIGAVAWNMASIVVLVWGLRVLVRDVLPGASATACSQAVGHSRTEAGPPAGKQWQTREGAFLTLTLAGSAVGIWSGQTNAILTALIALGLAAIVRQRWWTACWFLAVPVFIKLWPLALVLLLAVLWPRKLIGRFAAVSAALALVPFLTRPPSIVAWQYREWYVALSGPLQGRWPGYRDAWTIWEQLCPPVDHRVYMALQLSTALGVLGWCLWQRRRVEKGTGPICRNGPTNLRSAPGASHKLDQSPFPGRLLMSILSMWVSWQLLFGPGTEQLTYGIIAPSASWAVLVSFAEKRARPLSATAWALLALLSAGDAEKAVLSLFPAGMILLPIGVVLFVAWLVWHERGDAQYGC